MEWPIFMFGCMGAAAPEIIRLYKERITEPPIKNLVFYISISIAFILLGGAIAVILPTVTPWGAFYAGASLPVIISGAYGKPPKPPKPPRPRDTDMLQYDVQTIVRDSVELSKFDIREYLGKLFS